MHYQDLSSPFITSSRVKDFACFSAFNQNIFSKNSAHPSNFNSNLFQNFPTFDPIDRESDITPQLIGHPRKYSNKVPSNDRFNKIIFKKKAQNHIKNKRKNILRAKHPLTPHNTTQFLINDLNTDYINQEYDYEESFAPDYQFGSMIGLVNDQTFQNLNNLQSNNQEEHQVLGNACNLDLAIQVSKMENDPKRLTTIIEFLKTKIQEKDNQINNLEQQIQFKNYA